MAIKSRYRRYAEEVQAINNHPHKKNEQRRTGSVLEKLKHAKSASGK